MMTGGAGDLPLPDLVDAALSAVGSMCGAHIPSSVAKREDAQLCSVSCDQREQRWSMAHVFIDSWFPS
eukprot:10277234-Ditylum_brightwellii.AAC.1